MVLGWNLGVQLDSFTECYFDLKSIFGEMFKLSDFVGWKGQRPTPPQKGACTPSYPS